MSRLKRFTVCDRFSSRSSRFACTFIGDGACVGDSLASRGLLYSAQFCYLAAGEQLARHPLAPLAGPGGPAGAPLAGSGGPAGAPPRLSLLLGEPRAPTLAQFAHNKALFATEIYEYAMSLNQDDFVLAEFQVSARRSRGTGRAGTTC